MNLFKAFGLFTRKWGRPSPIFNPYSGEYEHGGLVWQLRRRCTPEDLKEVQAEFGDTVKLDPGSLVGKSSPNYTTYAKKNRERFKRRIKL